MPTAKIRAMCKYYNAKAAINETGKYGGPSNYHTRNLARIKKMVLDNQQYKDDGYNTQLQGIRAWADWLIASWPVAKTNPLSEDEKRLLIAGIMAMAKR
jgi:hypothetical protein